MTDFVAFPKMARFSREIIITEKIDGTNAQIYIDEAGNVKAGSRNRWITPEDDNYGFAAWVRDNEEELRQLGPGRHFGEWWGAGIQRRYGLDHKCFSLFNVSRWADNPERPACCHVVPVLYRGEFDQYHIDTALWKLHLSGSIAAPGFMDPEGIIIYHTAAGIGFKKTIKDDEVPKSKAGNS